MQLCFPVASILRVWACGIVAFGLLVWVCQGVDVRLDGNGPAAAPEFERIEKIDVHAHIFEEMPELEAMMRRNNLSIINVCNRGRDHHLETMHRIALRGMR